jgi:hypothetical protein
MLVIDDGLWSSEYGLGECGDDERCGSGGFKDGSKQSCEGEVAGVDSIRANTDVELWSQ